MLDFRSNGQLIAAAYLSSLGGGLNPLDQSGWCFQGFILIELKTMLNDRQKQEMVKAALRHLTIWSLSVACSLAIGLGFVLLIITIVGHCYELRHPIPIGEDDLGVGLIVVLWGGAASLLSIPLIIWLVWVFKQVIAKLLKAG